MMRSASAAALALIVVVAACVTVNKSMLSETRVAFSVPMERVQVYFPEDSVPRHARIAILNAEGDYVFTDEGQMIDKLREEAGKLGANAIIFGDERYHGIGARVAAAIFGTSFERRGQAIAIFVPSLEPENEQ